MIKLGWRPEEERSTLDDTQNRDLLHGIFHTCQG